MARDETIRAIEAFLLQPEIHMTRSVLIRSAMPLAAVLASASCGDAMSTLPDQCNILVATVTPYTPTIHPADTLTLRAAYTVGVSAACIPNVPAASLRWTSTAPAVVSVDSTTGIVTAHSAGSASVGVHAPGSEMGLGAALVTVTAP